MTAYTPGELNALVAPILQMDAEDIDHVIVLAVGKCPNCGKRNGYNLVHNAENIEQFVEMSSNMVMTEVYGEFDGG